MKFPSTNEMAEGLNLFKVIIERKCILRDCGIADYMACGPCSRQFLLEQPVAYRPRFLNPMLETGMETIREHLLDEHDQDPALVDSLEDADARYRFHDDLHLAEEKRAY